MTLTEDKIAFAEAYMETPFGAACVKKRGKDLKALVDDKYGHGILVTPTITQDMLKGHPRERLNNLLNAMYYHRSASTASVVTVRGHYHDDVPEDKMAHFVWTGTVREFNETWVVD